MYFIYYIFFPWIHFSSCKIWIGPITLAIITPLCTLKSDSRHFDFIYLIGNYNHWNCFYVCLQKCTWLSRDLAECVEKRQLRLGAPQPAGDVITLSQCADIPHRGIYIIMHRLDQQAGKSPHLRQEYFNAATQWTARNIFQHSSQSEGEFTAQHLPFEQPQGFLLSLWGSKL